MTSRLPSRRAERLVLVLRAAITAVAALIVTFAQERTGEFALLVFSMFALALAVLFFAESIWVRPKQGNVVPRVLGALHLLAGSLAQLLDATPDVAFHWVLIGWAAATGAFELAVGVAGARRGAAAGDGRDRIVVGALTLILAVVSLVVSPGYALDYFIEEAGQSFTLTGTIVGVGLFGGWAAIVAVFLGIGAMSPAPAREAAPSQKDKP